MASCDEQVGEIIQRIQIHVQPRRVRMREFFYDYDPLRCGRVTAAQFHRALATINFGELKTEEAELLAEYFTDHGPRVEKPQVVNYYSFCDLVEECDVEGNPDPLNSACSPGNTMMSTFRPNSVSDEEQVLHILHRLASLCSSRGVFLKQCFTELANSNAPAPSRLSQRFGGKVTIPQFLRMFPFTKDFSEHEIHTLIDRYKTKRGDVHFQAMHNDVSAVMSTAAPPFPTSPLFLRADHTQWSQQELSPIDKLRAKVVEKRIRLYEQFQDFDPLRKGFCTVGQVKTVFTIMNVAKEISKGEFEKLAYAYMREDGLFCYADFCRDVDRGFTQPGLERDPLAVVSMPDPSTTAPARRNTIRLSSERRAQIAHIEDKVKTRVRLRRVLIKPMFEDMDRARRGFITRNQFARAMGSLGFELSEIEVGLLAGVYCNYGNHLDFNYIDFCKCVDPPDDEVERATQQANAPFSDYQPSQYFDSRGKVRPMDSAVAVLC